LEAIANLKPTHIFANSEENRAEDLAQLTSGSYGDVLVSFPQTVDDVPPMIRQIADFVATGGDLRRASLKLEQDILILRDEIRVAEPHRLWPSDPKRYLYLIWQDPYMCAGNETYISSLWSLLGLENQAFRLPLSQSKSRYPTLDVGAMEGDLTDYVFLSSEPFPFRRRQAHLIKQQLNTPPRLVKVDGRLFSWHGSITLEALRQLKSMMLNPEWWHHCLLA
jgi:hypothetical protein